MTPIIDITGLWQWLLKSSGQAAVLVVLVLVAQWLLRHRLAPRWRHALWWLVVLRLVLPVSFESLVSVYNLAPKYGAWALPKKNAASSPLPTPVALPNVLSEPSPALKPVRTASTPVGKFESHTDAVPDSIPQTIPQPIISAPAKPPTASVAVQTVHAPLTWGQILVGVWLAGAGVLVFHVVQSQLRLRRWIADARTFSDPALLNVLDQCRQSMGVRRTLPLLEMEGRQSPALCGFFRPCLLLPKGLVEQFNEMERRHVFLHELAHLKRHDIAANWLTTVAQIVHWFNPFLWLGFSRMRADRESACDALALAATAEEDRKAYGHTIIKVLDRFSQSTPVPGLVGILENRSQLAQRIRMIAQFGRHYQGRAIAVCLIVGLGAVGLTDGIPLSPKDAESNWTPSLSIVNIPPRPVVTNGPSLKVTVLDNQTSKPIVGAQVYAPSNIQLLADAKTLPRWTTDTAGVAQIHLGEISPEQQFLMASFQLSVRASGYPPKRLIWRSDLVPRSTISITDVRSKMPNEVTVRLEQGAKIGGVLKDDRGEPVPQMRVLVYAMDRKRPKGIFEESPDILSDASDTPAVISDSAGRWEMRDFPKGLNNVAIEFMPPDGVAQRFATVTSLRNLMYGIGNKTLDLETLLAGQAVTVLKPWVKVRGIVVDPDGKPLGGVLVKEGYGCYMPQLSGEFLTDRMGRFERQLLSNRQFIFTAYPRDYAIATAIVDVGLVATTEVRLQVRPISPLRLHVVDKQGQPVKGINVSADRRANGQIIEFEGVTKADGVLTWTNAPQDAITLWFGKPDLWTGRKIRIPSNQREATRQMRQGEDREIQVHGQVRDADTGAPVSVESIELKTPVQRDFGDALHIGKSDFVYTLSQATLSLRNDSRYQLKLLAKGYDALIIDTRDFAEGDWQHTFLMRKGGKRTGQILLPDGKPAVKARIYLAGVEEGVAFCLSAIQSEPVTEPYSSHVLSNEQGRFELDYTGWDAPILVSHEQGMASTTIDRIAKPIVLEPWGRVEVVLNTGGQPVTDLELRLDGGQKKSKKMPCNAPWRFSYETGIEPDGHAVFSKVPPGEHVLSRRSYQNYAGPIVQSHPMRIRVKPGETTKIDYSAAGRPVIGRVTGGWDFTRHAQRLVSKTNPADPGPYPSPNDFATEEAYSTARDAFEQRRGFLTAYSFMESRSCYDLTFAQDGSFKVNDVPAGTYELRLLGRKPADNKSLVSDQDPNDEILTDYFDIEKPYLIREVVVPEMPGGRSDTPLDLGTLTLK